MSLLPYGPFQNTPFFGGTGPGVILVDANGNQQLTTFPDDPTLALAAAEIEDAFRTLTKGTPA
jgi:hypothetical protein